MKVEGEKVLKAGEMASTPNKEAIVWNAKESNQTKQNDDSASSSGANATNAAATDVKKAKSCKGCLYYSSHFKANSRKPLCLGLTRTFPNVPQRIVGETEMKATMEGKGFKEYRFGCWGYSLYRDRTEGATDGQQHDAELPLCVGYEVVYPSAKALNDGRDNDADSESAHSDSDIKQDGNSLPQGRSLIDILTSEEFLGRLTRNADLVANGVAKHMRRVGEGLKETLVDILYPYKRPPKQD